MNCMPDSLLMSLEKCCHPDSKKLVLIRHADREHIPHGTSGNNVHLTTIGKKKAIELGRNLQSLSVKWCRSSPLLRCTQTIDSISMGYGKGINYLSSELLGEPGPFVFDGNQAILAFFEHGTEKVVREMINGNTFPGIRSSIEGSEFLLKGLIKVLEENTGDGICVSHDSILMPFISHYCDEKFKGQWLPPLGGVVLVGQENEYTLWWDGNMHRVII